MAAVCGTLLTPTERAQTGKTITIRILEGKTARPIAVSNFLVRINHQKTLHGDWVRLNENGSGKLTVPGDADVVSIHATYDSSMQMYVNCDSMQEKRNPQEQWYAVSTILASGVVAPNGCSRMTETAQPGEFVFFVRKQSWREQMREYSSP
jgi:hypothetical protein